MILLCCWEGEPSGRALGMLLAAPPEAAGLLAGISFDLI